MSEINNLLQLRGEEFQAGTWEYDVITAAIDKIDALENPWISCDERKPMPGVLVLTWCEYSGYDVDYMTTAEKFTGDHPYDDGFPKTHWQPLTPPKGAE